ncbi:hypothetical protein [Spirosoma lituiforme]
MSYVLFYGWQVGYRKLTSVQLFQDIFSLLSLTLTTGHTPYFAEKSSHFPSAIPNVQKT